MALRKAPPEKKFAKFISPKKSIDSRAMVLLRLDPGLLERLDAWAAGSSRTALITEILAAMVNDKQAMKSLIAARHKDI